MSDNYTIQFDDMKKEIEFNKLKTEFESKIKEFGFEPITQPIYTFKQLISSMLIGFILGVLFSYMIINVTHYV